MITGSIRFVLRPCVRRTFFNNASRRRDVAPALRGLVASIAIVAAGAALQAGVDARLGGHVVDAAGRAIVGAEVIVRARASGSERRVLSDVNGAFVVEHLADGAYLVEARVAGSARSPVRVVELGGTAPIDIEIRVDRAIYEEQVVVTAEGRPQPLEEVGKAIAVVDRDQIAGRDDVSVAEALRGMAGVQVRLDGGPGQLASIRIRGLRSDAAAVLIDGLRFRDVTTTQGDASSFISNLNVINLDRAEVLRGSASSLYGTNAVGGAVNLVSRVGAAQPGGELQFEGGQLGLVRVRGTFDGAARDGRVRYSVGGLQLNVTSGIDGHDETRSTGGQGAMTAQLRAGTTLWGRLWASNDRVDLNTSPSAFEAPVANLGEGPVVAARALPPEQVSRLLDGQAVDFGSATLIPGIDDPDDERRSSFWTGALRLTHQARGGLSIDTSYQRLHTFRRYSNRPGGTGFQPLVESESDYTGNTDTLKVLATTAVGARLVVSGAYELEHESYADRQREITGVPGAFDAGTRVSEDAHALLASASLTPAARAHVAASLRVQAFHLDSPQFLPSGTSSSYDGVPIDAPPTAVTGDVAVTYGVGRDTKLRMHVGNAYRAPSLYERFGGGFSSDQSTRTISFTAYGDPRLEPDRYVSIDAGIDQPVADGHGRLRATWFRTWIQQLTEFDFSGAIDPATDPYGRFAGYINGGGGRSQGLELEADWRVRSLTVISAYTLTDTKTDKPLLAPGFFRAPAVARHTFSIAATERVGDHIEVVADLFARSAMYSSLFTQLGSRAFEYPSKAIVDLGGAWIWRLDGRRQLRAYAKIDNLFDVRSDELGWLTAGATFVGGLTLHY